MNISRLFIVRPVMTTLVMAAVALFGLIGYFSLPINDLPKVDFPTVSVSAQLPGASPETMASAVATPLEKQFSAIAGLDSMSSTSQMGSTSITLQFDLNRDIDGAAEDVQGAIVAARPLLPTSMPTPPTFRKVNPADMPILYMALSSPVLPLYTVDEYAENVVAPRVSMIDGVAQVTVYGSQIYAPHVQVDPRKMASLGIGLDEVSQAVQAANVNLPTGTLYGPNKSFNVMANGQLYNAAQFRKVIVTYRNGAPVRLSDIGDVIDSVQTDKIASWYNGNRAVVLAVLRQPNTNTIQIADNIKKLIPTFNAIIPGSVKLQLFLDKSQTIRRSIADVKSTLIITILLVVLVIFLFLGEASTTIIASLALPISVLGSFAAMKLSGFTLNNISLMALTLSIGFVIDDAIVVLENIVRHMEMGQPRMVAAMKGAQEVGFTVVSMTVSLVAVFIPILLMGGIIGRLFFEFGATISFAILISGFVSLTLTPMLCSRFLRYYGHGQRNFVQRISDRVLGAVISVYERTLKMALEHKPIVVVLFVTMVIATWLVMSWMPKGFMPSEDTGQVFGTTQAQEGISFENMKRHQQQVIDIVKQDKNVQGFMSSVGSGAGGLAGNQGRLILVLKPKPERKMTADEVINEMRKKLGRIPGIKLYMQNPPSIRMGGHPAKALYQVSLSGTSTAELYPVAVELEKKLKQMPALVDVNSDLLLKSLQLNINIDRDKCSRLGISVQSVQDALNSAYASRQVSVIYTTTNQYWLILEVQPKYYEDPNMLTWLRVRSPTGQLIPLDDLATVSRGAGPLQVNHIGQFPSVTYSFNLKPGYALGDAVGEVKDLLDSSLPEDITYTFEGTAQAFQSSTKGLGFLLVVSILIIYIVLGMLYESFIHPITILTGLPSAGLGALLCLILFQKDLDIYGFLGLILLIGIVKKNAIMMIDFAVEHQRQEGVKAEDAIYKACLVRFRPITMTTMAALFGSLPLAIGFGSGSEARQPLGLAIVGGLLMSQLVTLYITPVFYLYFEQLANKLTRRKRLPVQEVI